MATSLEFKKEPPKKCGLFELLVFLAAIITGTACSICSKTMMELHGIGMTGQTESFSKPIFQTFGMFVGMLFGLVMHGIVVIFRIPFPGYEHDTAAPGQNYSNGSGSESNRTNTPNHYHNNNNMYGSIDETKELMTSPNNKNSTSSTEFVSNSTPLWMYFFLIIPSVFDIAATALCMMGLRYLDVSIYQLLRGSGIIFVALMKQHVFKDHLYLFQWVGVFWNVVSVLLVGTTAILNSNEQEELEPGMALLGVILVMAGAFVQALQFVFEEKVMTMEDSAVPPLLLIGMEGFWGTVICLFIIYPLVYYLPGDDHGSYEDPFNTYEMFVQTPTIQYAFVIYFFAIFGYNLFAVLVTFQLSSIWHAILDNFRPITVWCTDMFIFYVITSTGDFGEPWTKYSILQAAGMCVLLYGTAVYNAPNAGSILLQGQWYAAFIDLTREYTTIHEAELDLEWQERQAHFKKRRASSLMAERSPYASIHTQALHGLASPRM